MRTSEKLRRLVKDVELDDKVICFAPQWEMHRLSVESFGSYKEADYILRENYWLAIIRNSFLQRGELSFVGYRLSKKEKFIHFAENNDDINKYLEFNKPKDCFEINTLCIDYGELGHGILNCFLDYAESFMYRQESGYKDKQKFINLNNFFSTTSLDIKTYSFLLIKKIIDNAYDNKLSADDSDKMDYLSSNHLQSIKKISFWRSVEKEGYLCRYNKNDSHFENNDRKDDYRFFYGLEPLLFWELKQLLKTIRRCKMCNSVFSSGLSSKIKYCQRGSKNYKKCVKKRGIKRQKEHYNKKKKKKV